MRVFRRAGTASALVAALGVAISACSDERGVMQTQIGDFLLEFPIDASVAEGRPAGGSTNLAFIVGAVDANHVDALNRRTIGVRGSGYANAGAFQVGWLLGADRIRNATNDPRLPALQSTTAHIPGRLIIGDPGTLGDPGWWNIWTAAATGASYGAITGLQPNTTYTVAFFRYGLQVNGMLDHIEAARGVPIAAPDQLVPVGGSPKGDPTVNVGLGFWPDLPAEIQANPWVLGRFTTDAGGQATLDFNISHQATDGTRVLYTTTSGNPSAAAMDSALVARNDTVMTTFPRYNYFVIMRGAAATAAEAATLPQVLRVQMGADLNAEGTAIVRNAYAPFPTAMTQAALLAGPGVAGQVSSLRATFRNLPLLANATYQLWLVNDVTGEAVSVPMNWRATAPNPDPDITTRVPADSAQEIRVFQSRGDWHHTFETTDVIAGRPIGTFTHVMISIESAEAAQPSAAQPLWVRYTDMKGDAADPLKWVFVSPGTAVFGTFNLGNRPVPHLARGAGRGWFWGTGPDDEMRVRFRDLDRPPVGFVYEGWMYPERGRGDPFALGPLTTGPEEGFASLANVDTKIDLSQWVREDRILDAMQRVFVRDILGGRPWHVDEYHLKLVPKAQSPQELPTYTMLGGAIPDAVQAREPATPQ
jgi:hypothetical protein